MDWLVVCGVSNPARFVFKDILLELEQEGLEDYAEDFFRACISQSTRSLNRELLRIAVAKALKEFLQLVQEELEIWGYLNAEFYQYHKQQYSRSLKRLIHIDEIKTLLGQAFAANCEGLDARQLEKTWQTLQLHPLPDEFDWEGIAKEYLIKVKALIQQSEALRILIAPALTPRIIPGHLPGVAEMIPKFDLKEYRKSLQAFYGHLKFDFLRTSRYQYQVPLTQMFIPQNVREGLPVVDVPKAYQQLQPIYVSKTASTFRQLQRHRLADSKQPSCSVLEILQDSSCQYLVILGDPGTGKSMLAQYIVLSWAEAPQSKPIPLLIELRNYTRDFYSPHIQPTTRRSRTFLEYIQQGSNIFHLNQHLPLYQQLKSGNTFVIFEGLDEVSDPAEREHVITEIIRFIQEFPKVRVLVTVRSLGYKPQQLMEANFRHFTLQELEPTQIGQFLTKWHYLVFGENPDRERLQEQLQTTMQASSTLRQLAGNPLLLSVIVILNHHQPLSQHRAELHAQIAQFWLDSWDIEKGLVASGQLGLLEKEAILCQVAYHMQTTSEDSAGNLISRTELEEMITTYLQSLAVKTPRVLANLIIEEWRTHHFILCYVGDSYYAFLHRSLFEYFCALYFVTQLKQRQTLTIETLKQDVFGKYRQDSAWHEILRLITGMVEPRIASEIIDYIIEKNGQGKNAVDLFLATKYLLAVKNRLTLNDTAAKLLTQLKAINKFSSGYDQEIRAQAISAIATAWKDDPETLPWLKDRAQLEGSATVRRVVVQKLAREWKHDPEILPWLKTKAQSDYIAFVRQAAVQELARGWKHHPDTLSWLQGVAQSDKSSAVRKVALQEIAHGWRSYPDILPWLQTLAQLNDEVEVRSCAVQEIARGWKYHMETLSWLKICAESDDDSAVRQTAMQEVIRGWKDDLHTLPWLKNRVHLDPHPAVRQVAVRELANKWKQDPHILDILKNRAQFDSDATVRRSAFQELIQGWKDHPDTLPWLKNCAHADADPAVRLAAVQELVKMWKNDPYILALLKTRAQLDEDRDIRRVAIQEIARIWKDDPSIITLLQARAQSDQAPVVRRAAIQGLARAWRQEPERFEFLRECATNDPFTPQGNREMNPRQTALEIIVEQYPHHPQTQELLQARSIRDPDERVREFASRQLRKLQNASG